MTPHVNPYPIIDEIQQILGSLILASVGVFARNCVHMPERIECALCNAEHATWRIAAAQITDDKKRARVEQRNLELERKMRDLTVGVAEHRTSTAYVEVPLGSNQARKWLGIKLSKWPDTSRQTLRESEDLILMPPPGFQKEPTKRDLAEIRAIVKLSEHSEIAPLELFEPVPLGPKVVCSHRKVSALWTDVCAECAGPILFRHGVKFYQKFARLEPIHEVLCGNPELREQIKDGQDRFQPYLAVRPDKGAKPDSSLDDIWLDDYELLQIGAAELLKTDSQGTKTEDRETEVGQSFEYMDFVALEEIQAVIAQLRQSVFIPLLPLKNLGFVNKMLRYLPPPGKYTNSPVELEKCGHGVSWGADNCRVCRDVVFRGKQAAQIWRGIDRKEIKATIKHDGEMFSGFVLVPVASVNKALGIKDFADPEELQRLNDIISASLKHTCVICGGEVRHGTDHCKDCARNTVLDLVPMQTDSWQFETKGPAANFVQTRVRPLSDRSTVTFEQVEWFLLNAVCQPLSEKAGAEIPLQAVYKASPAISTLMVRFFLWTGGTSIADIAAHEGTDVSTIRKYIERWTPKIQAFATWPANAKTI